MKLRADGFTLLEILLAVAIMGMVVVMLSLSLSGALKAVEGVEEQAGVYHQAQTALRRISEDLANAMPAAEIMFSGTKYERDGERADALQFASRAHLVFNPEWQMPGLAAIGYQVLPEADNSRKLRLLRSDKLLLPGALDTPQRPEDGPFVLADNLRSIRWSYVDRHGQEFESWEGSGGDSQQAESSSLPVAVYCTLEFWTDPAMKTSQSFSTGVLLPVSMFAAGAQSAK